MYAKESFMEQIRYRVGTGDIILFWLDNWIGDRALAIQFPDIYNCAADKKAKIHCYMERFGDHYGWNPILRRNLKDNKLDQYKSLLNLLSGAQIQEGVDVRRCDASEQGSFSVKSFFEVINKREGIENSGKHLEA